MLLLRSSATFPCQHYQIPGRWNTNYMSFHYLKSDQQSIYLFALCSDWQRPAEISDNCPFLVCTADPRYILHAKHILNHWTMLHGKDLARHSHLPYLITVFVFTIKLLKACSPHRIHTGKTFAMFLQPHRYLILLSFKSKPGIHSNGQKLLPIAH